MEKKEREEKLREITTSERVEFLYAVGNDDLLIEELDKFIQEELDKAREEGYQKGVQDGIEGKIFKKVEIKEEAHIPKELIEKIKRDGYDIGYEKGYERGIKYGTTGDTLTDSDIEEFERLDKKQREAFLKSIY